MLVECAEAGHPGPEGHWESGESNGKPAPEMSVNEPRSKKTYGGHSDVIELKKKVDIYCSEIDTRIGGTHVLLCISHLILVPWQKYLLLTYQIPICA